MTSSTTFRKKGVSKEKPSSTTHLDLSSQLFDAILQSKPKIVKRLMDARVDPNAINDLGETPLILACGTDDKSARDKMTTMLLNRGANVNTQDKDGNTPLMMAARKEDEELVSMLVEKGSDVSLMNNEGNTALCYAAIKGVVNIARRFVKEGRKCKLPIDHKNMQGLTPLLLAAQRGHLEVARVLVKDGGASLTIRDLDNFMTAEEWMKEASFYTPEEMSFLSPRGRHRRAKKGVKTLAHFASEGSDSIFQDQKKITTPYQAPFTFPLIQHGLQMQTLSSQDDATKSMFDLPSISSTHQTWPSSRAKPVSLGKLNHVNEHVPNSTNTVTSDLYHSPYRSKRKSFIGPNRRSKFYAEGSLQPLEQKSQPHQLRRMNSRTDKSTGIGLNDSMDLRRNGSLPPL